ncbi:hypothetical protein [Psychroserpens sp.]|uniref:hypothetical protein n=1 Tax=Psychroserpens sp. TaxID=2020870 RepID=UPI0038666CE3
MGLVLRYVAIGNININYRFLTHAHSHIAMLGWVYLMLFTFIVHYFAPENKRIYNRLFWLTQFAVIGMMLSFPFQGYGVISITFSTLHILCSYYFVYLIWIHHQTKSKVTTLLLKTSLVFMLLSTLGVWCLGPAVGLMGKASAFYQIAIQFFLHFQFNGWFLFAVIALFFHLLDIKDSKSFRIFIKLLIASTLLTLALPIHWFQSHDILLKINTFGVILQLIALFYFFKLLSIQFTEFKKTISKLITYCLWLAMFCLIIKSMVQLASILPAFAEGLYRHRNFVIGFIHLLMLGVLSGFLFSFILREHLSNPSKLLAYGLYSFFIGFTITEILLLFQGIRFYFGMHLFPNYYELLFVFSILLPLGISILIISIIKQKKG